MSPSISAPCRHSHLVDITVASDTYEQALCNDCGAVITGPLRGYLPKETPIMATHKDDTFDGIPGHVWVAQQRIIQDPDYRKTIVDWVAANGINPSDVPAGAIASIANGQLTIPLRVKDENGKYVIDRAESTFVTETVTVPLKVKPNSDVELWLTPKCPTCGR